MPKSEDRLLAEHLERVREALGERMRGHAAVETRTPLSALLAREEGTSGDDEYLIRREAFWALLDFFFAEGPDPERVCKRVFATTHALRPQLLGNMSLATHGELWGETRAAVSKRVRLLFGAYVARRSRSRELHLPFQKSETACLKYRAGRLGKKRAPKTEKPQPIAA